MGKTIRSNDPDSKKYKKHKRTNQPYKEYEQENGKYSHEKGRFPQKNQSKQSKTQ